MALKVAKAADGSLSAKLDSLDQGAKDLPVSMVRQSGLKVALELRMLDAAYDGTLKADGSEELSDPGRKKLDAMMSNFLRFTKDRAVIVEGYAAAGTLDEQFLCSRERAMTSAKRTMSVA